MKIGPSEIVLLILIAAVIFRPYLVRAAHRIGRYLSVYMGLRFHMLEKASHEAWKALKLLCIGAVVLVLLFSVAVYFALTH